MIEAENEIKIELEDIIGRLEETRNNALEMRNSDEMGMEEKDFDGVYADDLENMESSIFQFESFIDDIIQIIGEEIENLRNLVEKLDSTS
jgi:hypothetical protein